MLGLLTPLSAAPFDHSLWDKVLKSSVNRAGEVDYARLKREPAELDAYVKLLAGASPKSQPAMFPAREDAFAYYLNAYNALVTYGVSQAYPVKSVRNLGALFAFFRRKDYVLGGASVSLNDIEHEILRKQFADPRIHFAIVCASLSCPRLQPEAFTAANVESLLERAAREFFAERRNLEVLDKEVVISKLLDWYRGDFEAKAGSISAFVEKYAPGKAAGRKIRFRDYDWSINDPGSRSRAAGAAERELSQRQ